MDIFKEVKEKLTMRAVIELYGFTVNRSGFCCCPFHNEKTPSMKIYEKGYKCFGCGEGGDLIRFVEKYFNLPPLEACKKLNNDFSLGIEINGKVDPVQKTEHLQRQERRQILKDKEVSAKGVVSDYLRLLNRYSIEHKPANLEEIPDKQFLEFLSEYSYTEAIYDELLNATDFPFEEKERFYHDIEDTIIGILEKYTASQNRRLELEEQEAQFSEGNIIGNTDFKDITDMAFIKYTNSTAAKIAREMKLANIPYAGKVYSRLTAFTVNKRDIKAVKEIAARVSGKYSRIKREKEQDKPVAKSQDREI